MYTGKFQMPGTDGKMKDMNFKGMAIEGYDNVKKKFVSSWIDNMSTMIMNSEGTYDAATKTFTYNAECEMMPGMNDEDSRGHQGRRQGPSHLRDGTRTGPGRGSEDDGDQLHPAEEVAALGSTEQSQPAVGRCGDWQRAFCLLR